MILSYKKLFITAFTFLSISFLLSIVYISYWFQHPYRNGQAIIYIEKNTSLSQITTKLADQGVLQFPFLFKSLLYGTGEWRKLQAGEYEIPAHVTPAQLLHILKSGKSILHPVTLAPGETSDHFLEKLKEDSRFQGTCSVPPEGSLLPETYYFPRGTDLQVIVKRIQDEMQKTLSQLWEKRPSSSPLQTPQELVILASIVEKETALAHERPIIAAVFLNRLKIYMPLQADPTVLYAKHLQHKGVQELSLEDLKMDSPYNTYIYTGLPPTPIANPGRSSLEAVLHPKEVAYLYFVADGTGGHVFSTTLEEHQEHHNRWRCIRELMRPDWP